MRISLKTTVFCCTIDGRGKLEILPKCLFSFSRYLPKPGVFWGHITREDCVTEVRYMTSGMTDDVMTSENLGFSCEISKSKIKKRLRRFIHFWGLWVAEGLYVDIHRVKEVKAVIVCRMRAKIVCGSHQIHRYQTQMKISGLRLWRILNFMIKHKTPPQIHTHLQSPPTFLSTSTTTITNQKSPQTQRDPIIQFYTDTTEIKM